MIRSKNCLCSNRLDTRRFGATIARSYANSTQTKRQAHLQPSVLKYSTEIAGSLRINLQVVAAHTCLAQLPTSCAPGFSYLSLPQAA